ncbi:MAG: nitroreductase family protein [Tenericutes bacterium]|nr:nitroreductase family protein [Mycoplasmatota bacterium]
MEFETVIRERYSARSYSDKKIEKEKLNKILEAGRLAPTAKNMQPFKIFVIQSNEGIEKIDKATNCRFNAPTVLLVCGEKDKTYCEMDATIVTTHMMLEATNVGIANLWVELFDKEIVAKEFEIPENLKPVCLLMLGYKSETCHPSRLHNTRKTIEEIVEYK